MPAVRPHPSPIPELKSLHVNAPFSSPEDCTMKRIAIVFATVSMLLAAASCSTAGSIERLKPEIRVAQIGGNQFAIQHQGSVAIEYAMSIRNPTPDPITLLRVEMRTAGNGPYLLQNAPVALRKVVPPGETVIVRFTMWAWSPGGRTVTEEPVVLSGLAWFSGSTGQFSTRFFQRIRQPQEGIR